MAEREAGALDGEGGSDKRHKRLRDRLSNARKWKRERDEALGVGVVFEMDDPISIECSVDEVIDDIRGFNRTRTIAKRLRAIGALGDRGDGLREQSLNEVLTVIGEELLFLETVKVRRIDRARLNAAVRELDKEALKVLRKAQADYLAEIDDGDGDERDDEEVGQTPKSKIDASDSKIDA